MRPSVVLNLKRSAVREAAIRYCTANPRIFGSVLHGTDQDGSDLDLLVDALPGATLFDLGGLQDELESLLGIPVDLLTPTCRQNSGPKCLQRPSRYEREPPCRLPRPHAVEFE